MSPLVCPDVVSDFPGIAFRAKPHSSAADQFARAFQADSFVIIVRIVCIPTFQPCSHILHLMVQRIDHIGIYVWIAASAERRFRILMNQRPDNQVFCFKVCFHSAPPVFIIAEQENTVKEIMDFTAA